MTREKINERWILLSKKERERERGKKERRAEKQQLGGKGGDGRGWWKAMLVGR